MTGITLCLSGKPRIEYRLKIDSAFSSWQDGTLVRRFARVTTGNRVPDESPLANIGNASETSLE